MEGVMSAQRRRIGILFLSTACLLWGQQPPLEPSRVFSSETNLVLVPFHVVRGEYFAPDVRAEDVLLLDNGKPREFTIFEGPGTGSQPPLELVLLFDTTTLPPPESKITVMWTYWDREAAYEFASHWGDAESRAVLEKGGADVRVSVYRFDHQQLQRLCRSTKDPQVLTAAIRRLPEAIPADEAIPLKLPPGRHGSRPPIYRDRLFWPLSWTLEAVIDTLKDSTATPDNAVRALVVFSERTGLTTTTPQDAADQAKALGISVYPVVLNFSEYLNRPHTISWGKRGTEPRVGPGTILMPRPSSWPDYDPNATEGPASRRTQTVENGSTYGMIRFGTLAELTGGLSVYPAGMNGATVYAILDLVRDRSLAQYVVGFVPEASEKERKHRLEIKLKSKGSGKLQGGKRTAVY
jgi:hypothetical protein